jgi:hypothetical protein
MMAMSINKKPALKDHWRQDLLLCTPWVHNKMPRDMWLAIHMALHFNIIKIETDNNRRESACGQLVGQESYQHTDECLQANRDCGMEEWTTCTQLHPGLLQHAKLC